MGFLRKYKPYGVKFATPFGFSMFTLAPGEGFSVQLHRVAKVEAFHILDVNDGGFVLLCSREEWQAGSGDFLSAWERGEAHRTDLAFQPRRGDVIVVDRLEMVHAILGCVLEEYATTSNDAVERLYDQNAGRDTKLPLRHPSVKDVLQACGSIAPRRRVWRESAAWRTAQMHGAAEAIVDLPADGLTGRHVVVHPGESVDVTPPPDRIATIVCVSGRVRVRVGGRELELALGATTAIAPGEPAVVTVASDPCRIALCSVAADIALDDYRAC